MKLMEIKIGKTVWNVRPHLEQIENESLENRFYSWGEFSIPTLYNQCDGNNLAIRKCVFDNQIFIDCDFDKIDASDSTFINCLFLNCTFKNANFHNSIFIGSCLFNQDRFNKKLKDSFEGAGMSQSIFKSSNANKSILANLNLDRCGFRHSVFDDAVLHNISIEYTSFEDAYINHCTIDRFDLRRSACRGITIRNCKIQKYVSSVEKTLGAVGALQVLESCKEIELSFLDIKISNEKQLISKLQETSSNFLNEGKLFEFLNIMFYILNKTCETIVDSIPGSEFDIIACSKDKQIEGFPVSKIGEQLYKLSNQAYESISNRGKTIGLDDILYSLKLMFFFNINEYVLLKFFLGIFNLEIKQKINNYADFLVISQIRQYFHIIGERIKGVKYLMKFHNSNAVWQNEKDRNEFYEFCKIFIEEGIGENDFHLISLHEGSIDAIFESLFNINSILIASAILGCEFKFTNDGFSFHFSAKDGIKTFAEFLKEVASVLPSFRGTKPTKEDFSQGLEKIQKIAKKVQPYLKSNNIKGDITRNNASKIINETIWTSNFLLEDGKIKFESSKTSRKIIENE